MPRIYLNSSARTIENYPNGGNEKFWMNLIIEDIKKCFDKNGLNHGSSEVMQGLDDSIRQANNEKFDLYVALRSKKSAPEKAAERKGACIYHYERSENGKKLAEKIQQNYKMIYPEPQLVSVRTATTFIELSKTHMPAVLIETAYHDNPQDEIWLVNNTEEIARCIAKSVCEYYEMDFKYD